MKINRRQIEDDLIGEIDEAVAKAHQFSEHKADKENPHKVTAAQAGTYSASEIDAKNKSLSDDLNGVLAGTQVIPLIGALLTRVINGKTPVAINLFPADTAFISGKTLINDETGTIGVCIGDLDSATIEFETKAVSPIAPNEPTLLGNALNFAALPLTVIAAVELGWNTPRVDDYARVLNDETNDEQTAEWYISVIDEDGIITWANPVIINTSDYQAQTTAADAGRVLTGGAAAGLFGESLGIDSEPAEGSKNLISSGAVHAFFDVIYPVGSIYMGVVNSPPPIGTWVAWGAGRVPVGVDTTADFNTVEKPGGSKTVPLEEKHMPSHTHIQNSHSHYYEYHSNNPGNVSSSNSNWTRAMPPHSVGAYTGGSTAVNQNTGGNQAHNNLQPYITCYMFKRTA